MAPPPARQIERMALDLIKATALILALSLLGSLTVWTFWFRRKPAQRGGRVRAPVAAE